MSAEHIVQSVLEAEYGGYHDPVARRIVHALADAGLLAQPLPDRDEVIDLLQRYFWPFLAQDPANPDRFWGQSADAVLDLLKGDQS